MKRPESLKLRVSYMPSYMLSLPLVLIFAVAAGSAWADDRPGVPTVNSSAIGSAENIGGPEDVEAIKRVIVEMTEAFNKHDATAATRMYTPDADFVSVRGEMGVGRDRA